MTHLLFWSGVETLGDLADANDLTDRSNARTNCSGIHPANDLLAGRTLLHFPHNAAARRQEADMWSTKLTRLLVFAGLAAQWPGQPDSGIHVSRDASHRLAPYHGSLHTGAGTHLSMRPRVAEYSERRQPAHARVLVAHPLLHRSVFTDRDRRSLRLVLTPFDPQRAGGIEGRPSSGYGPFRSIVEVVRF